MIIHAAQPALIILYTLKCSYAAGLGLSMRLPAAAAFFKGLRFCVRKEFYAFSIVSRRLASGLFPKYVNIFRSSSISILEVCRVWLEEKKVYYFLIQQV